MQVFNSLLCTVCKQPFSALPNEPLSPWKLNCGEGICAECHQKESALPPLLRHHHCQWKRSPSQCFDLAGPAHFLRELIDSESLVISSNNKGYILNGDFERPGCSICFEPYDLNESKKEPFDLACNHLICNQCYWTMRRVYPGTALWAVECPWCRQYTVTNLDQAHNPLKGFLKELPVLRKQFESPGCFKEFEQKRRNIARKSIFKRLFKWN